MTSSCLFIILLLQSLLVFVLSIPRMHSFHRVLERPDAGGTEGVVIKQTSDGGFITVGYGSFPEDGLNILLIRYDMFGNIDWKRKIHSPGGHDDMALSLQITTDGDYLITGSTKGFSTDGSEKLLLMKFRDTGGLIFARTVGDERFEQRGSSAKELSSINEKNIVVVGHENNLAGTIEKPIYDGLLQLYDKNGNLEWGRMITYDRFTSTLQISDVIHDYDGNFILVGSTDAFGDDMECLILGVTFGNPPSITFGFTFGIPPVDNYGDYIGTIQKTDDYGYVVSGKFGSMPSDLMVAKFDYSMAMIWCIWMENTGGSFLNHEVFYIQQVPEDSGYIIATYMRDGSTGYPSMIKLNSLGGLEWAKYISSGVNKVFTRSVDITESGDFIFSGNVGSLSDSDVFLSLVSGDGSYSCGWDDWTTVGWNSLDVEDDLVFNDASSLYLIDTGSVYLTARVYPSVANLEGTEVLACSTCKPDHYDEESGCSVTMCDGYWNNDTSSRSHLCSGHGTCDYHIDDTHYHCECDNEYSLEYNTTMVCIENPQQDDDDDDDDGNDGWIIGVISGSSVLAIFLFLPTSILLGFCVLCSCICYFVVCGSLIFVVIQFVFSPAIKKIVSDGKMTENEKYLLNENRVDSESSGKLASLDINNSLFKIGLKEIKLMKVLGEGGSNSTVYLADFKGSQVAFKGFKTSTLCNDQDTFDEFEKEVAILGSLSHPGTLRFFGAVLQPPRVGIVMEYCPKGDLVYFLGKYKMENGSSYDIDEKIRMMKEISLAMTFLHSRNIIHRDLKCENVLITDSDRCKVMDFGCSKLVERMSVQKTERLGTPQYMAPEIVLGGGDYTNKVDVFSFAILVFSVLSEKFKLPYGKRINCVELKVANDEYFRPDVKLMGLRDYGTVYLWIEDLVTTCWKHDPYERYDFDEITQMFEKYR